MRRLLAYVCGASLASAPGLAQEVVSPAPAAPASSIVALGNSCCTIPALTPVKIEILVRINSRLNKIGEHFPIRLAAPIGLGGGVEVPKGIEGSGEIVHAAKSGFAGKPGELILAARYLDWAGTRIPLRSLTYAPGRGKDQTAAAATVAIAGGLPGAVISMFITGGEVDIPAGTVVYAKTAAPVAYAPASTETSKPTEQRGSPKP